MNVSGDWTVAVDAACNVTVTFSNMKSGILASVAGAASQFGRCEAPLIYTVNNASVQIGADSNPLLVLSVQVRGDGVICTGDLGAMVKTEIVDSGTTTHTLRFQSTIFEPNPGKVAGDLPSHDAQSITLIASMPLSGTQVGREDAWQLTRIASTAALAPKDETPKDPLLGTIDGKFERFFLNGIGPVPNEYRVSIDWRGETPGTVAFTLDGAVLPGEPTSTGAVAPLRMDTLAVGVHNLTITATSTKGRTASRSRLLHIVAVPAWAQEFRLQARHEVGLIRYIGQNRIDTRPAFTSVAPTEKFLGGSWGANLHHLEMEIAARSTGQITSSPSMWTLPMRIGSNNFLHTVYPVVRLRLTERELRFVDGQIIPPGNSMITIRRTFGEIFPSFPLSDRQAKLDILRTRSVLAWLQISGSHSVNFGIAGDKFRITDGMLAFDLTMNINHPGHLGFDEVNVSGALRGRMTMTLQPDLKVVACQLSGEYTPRYTIKDSGAPPDLRIGQPIIVHVNACQ